MWPALFYVNSLNFQQWNSNWDIAFFNSSLNSKLGFLNVGLRFVNVALVGLHNFFQIHESDGTLGFLNVSLGCTSKFLPIH